MSIRATVSRTIAVGGLLACVVSPGAAQDDAERAALAREVAAALRAYHAVFSGKDGAEMAARGYGAPLMSLGSGSHVVWPTRDEVAAWAQGFVDQLQTTGWDRSSMPEPSICILTPTSAIASGEFVRYRADGSVLSRHGNAYVFSKGDDGWRVVAMLSHDPRRPLTCD